MKQRKEKSLHRNKGITLIALVVTIILLLILAGVSIYFVANSGLVGKVEEAKNKSNEATQNDLNALDQAKAEIEKYLGGNGGINPEELAQIEYEFDKTTGTITGIKNKANYYEGGWTNPGSGNPGIGRCILPGGTVVVVPSQIDGVEVKAIKCQYGGGSGVFAGTNITKLVIPATVTQIGPNDSQHTAEFLGCESLKEVIIESNTITMGTDEHFYRCNNLEKITFTNMERKDAPAGAPWAAPKTCTIAYKGDKIEYEFDASMGAITGIKNKQDYYTIKGEIREEDHNLWDGWSGCIFPESEIYIPSQINGVTVKKIIDSNQMLMFNECWNVKKVVIPDTVNYIGDYVLLSNMSENIEVVIESHAPLTIHSGAFSGFKGKITFTNITAENAPEGAPWGASSSTTVQYK